LHRCGVNHDIADERTVEQFGKRNGDEFALGNCKYQRVIPGEGCEMKVAVGILPAGNGGGRMERVEIIGVPESSCANPDGKTPPYTAGRMPAATIAIAWSLKKNPLNLLLLESAAETSGWFAATFSIGVDFGNARLELIFADDITAAELNEHNLTCQQNDDGTLASVDSVLIQPVNFLRFRTANPQVQRPFVWLRGAFRVASRSPFIAGPNGTVKTAGPLALHPAQERIQSDLVAGGFPFLRESIVVTANLTLPAANSLSLVGAEADAARLWIDGRDCGWNWRTDGGFNFAAKFTAGVHTLRLELVPNTFNAFGPHHYFAGDWHIVSPDQIRGVKNFADAPDAPMSTHVAAWHFRRLRLPEAVSISSADESALQGNDVCL